MNKLQEKIINLSYSITMHSIIRILDDTTINQIAAGEVIENPASVIKELVENALDADATVISIDVEGSGRLLIRITDNGIGMNSDDAKLCFERHATSKVYKIEDLDKLASMGFRGEALPSIASIAKVRLISRPRDQEKGALVEIQGGKILSTAEVPCEAGTSIEVSDLFYNVPARRKFLKSPKADLLEIQKMVSEIAIGNTLVHFILTSDGDTVLDIPLVATHMERARQLLNESVFESMLPFEYKEGDIKLEGLISEPMLHRPNRTGQALFLNQRPVSSWEIAQSVLQGYGTSLPERRYPLFHLHLTLPPAEFDVNVHPQKKEVRFCHLSQVKDVVRRGVSQALNQMPSGFGGFTLKEESPVIYEPVKNLVPPPLIVKEKPSPAYTAYPNYFEREKMIPIPSLPLKMEIPKILARIPFYILLEDESGFQAVDIQRARKRIIYEKVVAGFKKRAVENQLLLVPLTLNLGSLDGNSLMTQLEAFNSMGFSIQTTDQAHFIIHSIPSFLKEEEVESVLMEMLKAVANERENALIDELSLHVANAAVQHIFKENKILSEIESEHLIQELFACQQPRFTSSGQSIIAKVSWDDLGRFF